MHKNIKDPVNYGDTDLFAYFDILLPLQQNAIPAAKLPQNFSIIYTNSKM